MALKDIKETISRFLTSPEASVLVLSGAWGTGKTFIWQDEIDKHRSDGNLDGPLARKRDTYISAVGCENINDLKTATLSQTSSKGINFIPDFVFKGISVSEIVKSGLGAFAELRTKNAIICIDDIERAEKIKPYDILHYAAFLRDEGNCKVALLLNNVDRIEDQEDSIKEKFQFSLEKSANYFLKLNLSPKEASDTWERMTKQKMEKNYFHPRFRYKKPLEGFSTEWIEPLKETAEKLGTCNIRVIEHIATALRRWYPFLEKYQKELGVYKGVKDCIFYGTAIIGWGYFEPDLCFSWEHILEKIQHEELLELSERRGSQIDKRKIKEDLSDDVSKNSKEKACNSSFVRIKEFFKSDRIFGLYRVFEELRVLLEECGGNIKNGYLSKNVEISTKGFIDKRCRQKLFNEPLRLFYDVSGDRYDPICEALEKIPFEFLYEIDFNTVADIIDIADRLKKHEWVETFVDAYQENFSKMPDSFFMQTEIILDSLDYFIIKRSNNTYFKRSGESFRKLHNLWKNERNRRESPYLFPEWIWPDCRDRFISEIKRGNFWRPKNLDFQVCIAILKILEPKEASQLLTGFEGKGTPGFKLFSQALKEMCNKNYPGYLLWRARFNHYLKEYGVEEIDN